MNSLSRPEKFQLIQIFRKSSQLQTADSRRAFLRLCGLEKYSGLLQLDQPVDNFAVSLLPTLLNANIDGTSGLIACLETLIELDASLSEEERNVLQSIIAKREQQQESIVSNKLPSFEEKKPILTPQPQEQVPLHLKRDSVFISYSHQDRKWLEKIQIMLKPLIRNQTITVWDDTQIKAGSKWRDEIRNALATANVAVLMVSPYFLASDFIQNHELPSLLETAEAEGLKIIWIYISPCLYKETEIEKYQAAHDISRPLNALNEAEQDQVLLEICQKIKQAFEDIE